MIRMLICPESEEGSRTVTAFCQIQPRVELGLGPGNDLARSLFADLWKHFFSGKKKGKE